MPPPNQPPSSCQPPIPPQPTPNPNNKVNQPVYNSEVASYLMYPVNSLAINGVQLQSSKDLQGPTITEIGDSPDDIVEPENNKQELEEPPFLERLKEQPPKPLKPIFSFDFME